MTRAIGASPEAGSAIHRVPIVRTFVLVLLGLGAIHAAAGAPLPDAPPAGHTRAISLPVTREPPKIDGNLDDEAWTHAATADQFWNSLQERPPTDRTEVLVIADRTHLYFGFKVYESRPADMEALQTRRDADLGVDDQVGVVLDPYLTFREVSTYRVNAIGTQRDEVGGGRARQLAWKGDWQARVVRTSYGWTAEIAIPYSILNFQPGTRTIGVNFIRFQHRTQEWSSWADTTVRSLPEEMGRLTDVRIGLVGKEDPWTLLPYVLAGRNVPDRRGEVRDRMVDGGIDIRYEPQPNLTGVLSIRPDFSQVERSITDIDFSYNEKYRPDPRPFFQEGSAYFTDDRAYFYSNRVPTFDVGLKGFGRLDSNQFGALAVRSPGNRNDGVLHLDHQFDATHYASGTIVATDRPDLRNEVYAIKARGREASGFNYALDGAYTQTDPVGRAGTLGRGSAGWASGFWSFGAAADRYSKYFDPQNGLLAHDLPDTSGGSAFVSYYRDRASGLVREVRGDLSIEQRDTGDGRLQRRRTFASGSVELREQQIRLGGSYYAGPYRPVLGGPGEWSFELNHDHYWTGSVDFNTRSSRVGYGVSSSQGFLGGDDYHYMIGYAWARPTATTIVNVSAEQLENFGTYRQTVVSGGWDITPAHSVAFRVIDAYYGNAYRMAYTWRARTNVDLFMVWDSFPGQGNQLSAKILMTL